MIESAHEIILPMSLISPGDMIHMENGEILFVMVQWDDIHPGDLVISLSYSIFVIGKHVANTKEGMKEHLTFISDGKLFSHSMGYFDYVIKHFKSSVQQS